MGPAARCYSRTSKEMEGERGPEHPNRKGTVAYSFPFLYGDILQRLRVQAAEMGFTQEGGLEIGGEAQPSVRNSVESLLHCLGIWCPLGTSPGRSSRHVQCGGGLGEDPGLGGEIISQYWPGNASGSPPSELVNVARERELWVPLLELLPPRPDPG